MSQLRGRLNSGERPDQWGFPAALQPDLSGFRDAAALMAGTRRYANNEYHDIHYNYSQRPAQVIIMKTQKKSTRRESQ